MDCQELGIGPAYVDSAYNDIAVTALVVDDLGYPPKDRALRLDRAQFEWRVVDRPRRGSLRPSRDGLRFSYEAAPGTREGLDTFAIEGRATDAKGQRRTYLLKFTVAVVEGITNEALPSACERWAAVPDRQPPVNPAPSEPVKSRPLLQGR